MCWICEAWRKRQLTSKEALQALGELIKKDKNQSKHCLKVSEEILDREVPLSDTDEEMDKLWYDETKRK